MSADYLDSFMNAAKPDDLAVKHTEPVELTEEERTGDPMKDKIISVLKSIYDPEIPVDIYSLGLIYDIAVDDGGSVHIKMTLTTPMCPVAESMPGEVQMKILSQVEGVSDVEVELVWDPPWNPAKLSEIARLELGLI